MDPKTTIITASQKQGRNLFCEILIFLLVYAVSYLGNLLLTALLLEWFYLPDFGSQIDFAALTDPLEIVARIMALPYFSVMMLFSTAATILVVILFCRFLQKRSWGSMGLSRRNAFPYYIRGYFWGAVALSVPVAVCVLAGAGSFTAGDPTSPSTILLFFLAYLIQGASEEILCRGYFMNSIARRYPMWVAVLVSSVVFAWMHMPNNGLSLVALLDLTLFGVFAALVTIRTGSVWFASGFHSAWNFFQGNIFGVKVSGMDMYASLFRFVPDPAKAWLNGGDFGIEGSLLSPAFTAAMILFLLFRDRRKTQKIRR